MCLLSALSNVVNLALVSSHPLLINTSHLIFRFNFFIGIYFFLVILDKFDLKLTLIVTVDLSLLW